MPVYGTCVKKYLNSIGYSIAITVTLRPKPDFGDMVSSRKNAPYSNLASTDYNTTDESELNALIHVLATNKAMKLSKSKCGLCGTKIYKADDLSYIVMVVTYTTKKCNTSSILNLVETFQYSPPFQPQLTFDFQIWDDISMNAITNTLAMPVQFCPMYFVLKETTNCPRIQLNQTEFEAFVRKTNFNVNVSKFSYRTR